MFLKTKCFVKFLDFHFNSNKKITGANQNSRRQNHWMNDLQKYFSYIIGIILLH